MNIFNSIKLSNVIVGSVCAVSIAASTITACVLWPKEDKAPIEQKNNQTSQQEEQQAPTEDSETSTTPEPTPEPVQAQIKTTSQNNTPNVDPTPTHTPTCEDYDSQYYAEYSNEIIEINTRYTNELQNYAENCKNSSGCSPQDRNKIESKWKSAVGALRDSYKAKMRNVGCNSSQYIEL